MLGGKWWEVGGSAEKMSALFELQQLDPLLLLLLLLLLGGDALFELQQLGLLLLPLLVDALFELQQHQDLLLLLILCLLVDALFELQPGPPPPILNCTGSVRHHSCM